MRISQSQFYQNGGYSNPLLFTKKVGRKKHYFVREVGDKPTAKDNKNDKCMSA